MSTPLAPTGSAYLAHALATLRSHQEAAERTLTLIPAENLLAPIARLPLIADAYARYMFDDHPDPASGQWHFPAARTAAWLETGLAIPLLRYLGRAEHVNVRPLSGLNAMQLLLAALGGPPGSRILVIAPGNGGHYASASLARRMGLHPIYLSGPEPHHLDLDALARACTNHQPSLVYIDQCHGLVPFNLEEITAVVRRHSPSTYLHADVSHWLGLILGRALPNPLDEGVDSYGGSTHKSFPGPHKGVLLTNTAEIAARWRAVQPELVSSHHFGAVASLGLALAAFLDHGPAYATAVVQNTQILGKHLAAARWQVAGEEFGYSAGHQLWVSTAPRLPAQQAAGHLAAVGIYVNWLEDLPLPAPALRLGLAEATWLGLTGQHMPQLAHLITSALTQPEQADRIAEQVAHLRTQATYPYVPALPEQALNDAIAVLDGALGPILRDLPDPAGED